MAELGLELRGSNIVDQLVEKQLDLEKREAALKSKVEEVVALKARLDEAEAASAARIQAVDAEMHEKSATMDDEIKKVRRERLMERLKARLLAEAECKDMKLECKEVNATATEETQADLARMRAQMEAEVASISAALHIEEEKLGEAREQLEKDIVAAREHAARTAGRVELDVGGQRFVTSIETLTAGSQYFKSMFSGMWEASDSPIFIDRDPAMFALILKCLRCGCDETVVNELITCPLPLNEDYLKVSRRELFLEVEFFQLDSIAAVLSRYCKPPAAASG